MLHNWDYGENSYLLSSKSKALWMIPHIAKVAPDRENQMKEREKNEFSPNHFVGFLLKAGFKAIEGRRPLPCSRFKF